MMMMMINGIPSHSYGVLLKIKKWWWWCHLSYGITQYYLPPDTSEHTPP